MESLKKFCCESKYVAQYIFMYMCEGARPNCFFSKYSLGIIPYKRIVSEELVSIRVGNIHLLVDYMCN